MLISKAVEYKHMLLFIYQTIMHFYIILGELVVNVIDRFVDVYQNILSSHIDRGT